MNIKYAEQNAFKALNDALQSYAPLSNSTWLAFKNICSLKSLEKHQVLYPAGEVPSTFAFVVSGLLRIFVTNEQGKEYNKNFFDEGKFPGSMTALLTSTASNFIIDAIEPSVVIEINFKAYRKLLIENNELKLFQIYYLERNWLLAKDSREVELVQQDSQTRYQLFRKDYPQLHDRLPQYHVASHLGITPTQLSRIRKNYSGSQPM